MYQTQSQAALDESAKRILEVHPARYKTIQEAVDEAQDGSLVLVHPGVYDETVTVPFAKSNIEIAANGPRFSVKIKPTATGAKALVVDGWNIAVNGIDVIGQDTATAAALITGDQFHTHACRYENNNNVGYGLHFKSKGLAAYTATPPTAYSASIPLIEDCEFAWLESGIVFEWYSSLSPTQPYVKNSLFRNLSVNGILATGASPSVLNVMIEKCLFERNEDGSAPSNSFISLANAGDTGVVSECSFAYPTFDDRKIKLAATVIPVACRTLAGISVAVPTH